MPSKKSSTSKANGADQSDAAEPTAAVKEAKVVMWFRGDATEVEIVDFQNLTPRKIQRSIGAVLREWNQQRRQFLVAFRAAEDKKKQAEQQAEGE